MGLDKYDVEIIMGDAYDLFTNHPEKLRHGAGRSQFTDHYDLICFDTYIQQDFPKKFESVSFIKQVKKLLTKNGLAIFNRLYGSEERDRAIAFEKVLLKVFPNVERVYPEANVMFVCSSRPWKACDAN
jgi:spermidine synthase